MADVWFLEANQPLCKSYHLGTKGEVVSSPYPLVSRFQSHKESVSSVKELHTAISKHADLGRCLIKGKLHRDLEWADRRKATVSTDPTQWACLDLDGAPFASPEEFMLAHPALTDVSYVVQYSASHGLGKSGLRCHIFMLLDKPTNAPLLKSWLMGLNLDGNLFGGKLRQELRLNESSTSLHWPLDITCCQNDKIIYVAPPRVGKGVPYKAPNPRIKLVEKKYPVLPTVRLDIQKVEVWRTEARAIVNNLRKELGLNTLRATRMVEGYEVQGSPGHISVTEVFDEGEFVRLNLNGGDSKAYWHPKGNFKFIHSFKGEPSIITAEACPDYYQDCMRNAQGSSMLDTDDGEVILGVCDKRSSALVKISWNPKTKELQLYPAKNDKQLQDWLLQHNRMPGEFVPQWDFRFDPELMSDVIDLDAQRINTYVPGVYKQRYAKPRTAPTPANFPTIAKVITSMVSGNQWTELTDHLMNWIACIVQTGSKIGTAWLVHGTEGTGKGLFVNSIMAPLLGRQYVKQITITRLEDQFNGWLERCQFCFIDELEVSSSVHKKIISGTLRNWITEPYLDMRNMNQMAYNAQSYTNFFVGSNKPAAVMIDASDRRYNIGDFQNEKLVITQQEVEVLIPQELQAFFDYLMSIKADMARARTLMMTESRRNVILASRNSLDMLCDALKEGDIEPFVEALPDIEHIASNSGGRGVVAMAFKKVMGKAVNALLDATPDRRTGLVTAKSKITRDELFTLFEHCIGDMPASPNKFTRMLKHKGIDTKKIRGVDGNLAYGIEVEWKVNKSWQDEFRPIKTRKSDKIRRVI